MGIDEQLAQMANIPMWRYKNFLATLIQEKQKYIDAHQNDAKPDPQAIAEAEAQLEKLHKLKQSEKPPVALAKKPVVVPFGGKQEKNRMVAQDEDMADVLEVAMKDAKGNRAVNDAMK